MGLWRFLVQKFGGTSVGSIDRIRSVARRCLAAQREGNDVVVIVSAMSGETNRLLALAHDVTRMPDAREMDVIAATGEQTSAALVALAIQAEGGKARSLLGHQVKILTDGAFTKARIRTIEGSKIFGTIADGQIAVVAGFQGVDDQGNITTLGRGGSDTTAVAVAAAIGASACEIFTDVDGVYTTDPNICPGARKIARISYEEMLELASLGAKVLQIRSVEIAMNHAVPIHVRSSFSSAEGDVGDEGGHSARKHRRLGGRLRQERVARAPRRGRGQAGRRREDLRRHRRPQRVGRHDHPERLRRPLRGRPAHRRHLHRHQARSGARQAAHRGGGARHRRPRGPLRRGRREGLDRGPRHALARGRRRQDVFQILAGEGINIQAISTSEIKISCLVASKYTELAVRALHDGFDLAHAGKAAPRAD